MGLEAPHSVTVEEVTAAVAAGADAVVPIHEVTEVADVTSVSYVPVANITGDTTETRTLTLVNKGSDGSGTTVLATLAFITGVNGTANDEKAFTLGTVVRVQAGDELAFSSAHGGSTGLADPGGLLKVELAKA